MKSIAYDAMVRKQSIFVELVRQRIRAHARTSEMENWRFGCGHLGGQATTTLKGGLAIPHSPKHLVNLVSSHELTQ